MHREEPSPRNRTGLRYPGWLALFFIWTLVGAFGYIRHRLDPASPPSAVSPLKEFAGWLTCFYPWILLGPLVFRLEDRFPLKRTRWLISSPILISFGLGLAFVAVKLSFLLNMPLDPKITLRTLIFSVPAFEFFLALLLYWNVVIAGAFIRTCHGTGAPETDCSRTSARERTA